MEKEAPGGYAGKILRVNLTEGNISSEVLDERTARRYLGGAGFIVYYLWKELKQGAPGWIGFSKGLARRPSRFPKAAVTLCLFC